MIYPIKQAVIFLLREKDSLFSFKGGQVLFFACPGVCMSKGKKQDLTPNELQSLLQSRIWRYFLKPEISWQVKKKNF